MIAITNQYHLYLQHNQFGRLYLILKQFQYQNTFCFISPSFIGVVLYVEIYHYILSSSLLN